ncbi:MAG: trehalose-binding protein [Desulfovibrio sp.]|nr:trehalose-binding protein [Desulfovibrio sp.]
MNIGAYSFEEFRRLAENFHGYAAPGLLIGGYMVEKAKAALPEGTLFEAVVETPKCLPDAVQLLTACSTGNQRLKIHNLGRYAVTLFDKYSGKGVRVSLDGEKMKAYPELYAWFFKKKPKKEQDSARLEAEIRAAGDTICNLREATINPRFIGVRHMTTISVCPVCAEAYPSDDGPICRGCQGEAPYSMAPDAFIEPAPRTRVVPVEEAVGRIAAHDMTRIEPGHFKGAEFRAGQRISPGDVCRLQQMGKFNVAITEEDAPDNGETAHENQAARAFAARMAGDGIEWDPQPREGKIDFRAALDGVLRVDEEKLARFNLVPEVMAAARQDGTIVRKDGKVAGTRAIPLYLSRSLFSRALAVLEDGPLFRVAPMRAAKTGILVTGTEVFKGLIEDKFMPVISAKILALGSEVVATEIIPDDRDIMKEAVDRMLRAGVDLLITTGGLSVDPDDITRSVMLEAGLKNVVHGVPVLPGTMSLVGELDYEGRKVNVVGVPACALYYKTTFFDLVLPRLLAGDTFTRAEAAKMGSGGYCLSCKVCSWPKCSFGK